MSDVPTDAELRRHHRRARNAPIEDWHALGIEHGREDALACYAGLSLSNQATVHNLQRQRMADRRRRFETAGISEERIAAWLEAHTITFARHMAEISRRGSLQISGDIVAAG